MSDTLIECNIRNENENEINRINLPVFIMDRNMLYWKQKATRIHCLVM